MKYIRVVFAVADDDVEQFNLDLDAFIEDTPDQMAPTNYDGVQGAYVSAPYATRAMAIDGQWKNKEN